MKLLLMLVGLIIVFMFVLGPASAFAIITNDQIDQVDGDIMVPDGAADQYGSEVATETTGVQADAYPTGKTTLPATGLMAGAALLLFAAGGGIVALGKRMH